MDNIALELYALGLATEISFFCRKPVLSLSRENSISEKRYLFVETRNCYCHKYPNPKEKELWQQTFTFLTSQHFCDTFIPPVITDDVIISTSKIQIEFKPIRINYK